MSYVEPIADERFELKASGHGFVKGPRSLLHRGASVRVSIADRASLASSDKVVEWFPLRSPAKKLLQPTAPFRYVFDVDLRYAGRSDE